KLGMQTQPGNGTAGSPVIVQPVVLIEDPGGNRMTSDSSTRVTVALGTNAGGGTLGGTATVTAVGGAATFTDLSIDKAGNGYTLTFTASPTLAGVTSSPFNVAVGAASKLGMLTQPGNGTGGSALSREPVVLIQDAQGNTI